MSSSGHGPDAERDDVGGESEAETDVEGTGNPNATPDPDPDVEDEEGPVEVGDDREKHVQVTERSGERTEHAQVYLRHTTDEFVISSDDSFPADETTRYSKADLLRVEVAQQHSTCFITTATVGESETLDLLRGFREGVLRRTRAGRRLVGVYERVSPPIAHTLSRHPTARTTRLVRRLVAFSGALVDRRNGVSSRPYRGALSLVLTFIYLVGVCCALAGHTAIRLCESITGTQSVDTGT